MLVCSSQEPQELTKAFTGVYMTEPRSLGGGGAGDKEGGGGAVGESSMTGLLSAIDVI